MEQFTQAEIIKGLVRGDIKYFDFLYEKYNKRVYALSLKNLRNREEAEGMVQEVFLNLWEGRRKLKEINNLDAWIFTLTFNVIRKRFRKISREQKHVKSFTKSSLTEDNSTVTEIEYADLLNKAQQIIEKLPPRQKDIYLLSKKQGLSNSEISVKLNISQKTVENHLSLAKKFLKKSIQGGSILLVLFFYLFIS